MTYRKGYVPVSLSPMTLGAGTQAAHRIMADLHACATEIKNIGLDTALVEIALNAAITILANEQMFAGDTVTVVGTLAVSSNPSHIGKVLGIALNNAAPGEQVTVARYGIAPNTYANAAPPGTTLWLANLEGAVTTACPTSGFQQRLAIVLSAAVVIVSLGDPIILGGTDGGSQIP